MLRPERSRDGRLDQVVQRRDQAGDGPRDLHHRALVEHCTGGSHAFWSYRAFRQYDDSGGLPGDQHLFNGSRDRLGRFAANRATAR